MVNINQMETRKQYVAHMGGKNDSNRKASEKTSMNDLPIQLLVRDMVVSITRNEYQEKRFGQKK